MKISGFVYLNGRFVAAKNARISVFDRGLLYGDGLLESLRAYSGRPFVLERHLERLASAAAFLEIPVPEMDWTTTIEELLRRNRVARCDAWVRITLTRGVGARGLNPPAPPSPTLLITAGEIDSTITSMQRRGVRLIPVPWRRDTLLARFKTLSYLPGILAKAAAARAGADDALFTDDKGHVLETTTANVFVWKGQELWTPRQGMLPGVTRALVIEAARALGLRVRERALSMRELTPAREAFVTSSLVEILPVVEVAGVRLGDGKPGPRTRRLARAYRRLR